MSEMKPVFWIKKEHFAEFEGARGDLGLTIVAWNNSLNEYAKAHELKSMEVPLYTADQLSEAVTAERERIEEYVRERGAELDSTVLSTAFVCDVIAEEIRDGIDLNNAKAPEAIRSAAK